MNDDKELPLSIASKRDEVGTWLAGLAPWRCDDRACWLEVGMILHWWAAQLARNGYDLDDELLTRWDEWSAGSSKYQSGECARQWEGFDADRPNPAKLGTLAAWYREDQQTPDSAPPEPQPVQDRSEDDGGRLKVLDADEVKALSAKLKITKSAKPVTPAKPAGIAPKPPAYKPASQTLDALIAATAKRHGAVKATPYTDYLASDGSQLCALRLDLPDGSKTFCQFSRHADGPWRRGGLDGPNPLYRRSQIEAAPKDAPIVVVEGEKCADAGAKIGLTTTTTAGGAQSPGKSDLTPLAGRTVYLMPDNDEPGEQCSRKLQQLFAGLNPQPIVKVVRLPGLTPKGDLFDFIEVREAEGKTPEQIRAEILALAASAEPVNLKAFKGLPVLKLAAEVTVREIYWLWKDRIALGKLVLFTGNAGVGKTFLWCDLAASITLGKPLPGDDRKAEPASVVVIAPEDDQADTLVPRLQAAGADLTHVYLFSGIRVCNPKTGSWSEQPFSLPAGLIALERALADHPDVVAIIIDPVTAILGQADSNDVVEVRAVLQPLVDLAERFRVAIICTSHLNKATGQSAIHRTLGSGAFQQIVRASFILVPDKGDDSRKYLLPVKSSNAAKPPGLMYVLEPSEISGVPRVRWEAGIVEADADSILAASEGSGGKSATKTDAVREALEVTLEDGEWMAKDAVVESVRKKLPGNVSIPTIERAAKALGVEYDKTGFRGKGLWRLPQASAE